MTVTDRAGNVCTKVDLVQHNTMIVGELKLKIQRVKGIPIN